MGGDGWTLLDPGGLMPSNPGSPKNPENNRNRSAEALAEISKRMFEQTDPLRTGLIDRGNAFLSGNLDVTQSPMFGALKSSVESQFGRARDNVMANTARGGGLVDALTNLEGARANTMVGGMGELAQSELDRSFGLATGLLPSSTSGLGSAAATQGAALSAQSEQNAAAKMGAGQGVGSLLAAGKTAASDRRLKKQIREIGVLPNGLTIYEFEYVEGYGRGGVQRGVMADEVRALFPEAVFSVRGYDVVNYGMIGAAHLLEERG